MSEQQVAVALPNNKEELLKLVDGLPYAKRIELAARLGVQHKNSPQLQELIKELREHEAPSSPVASAEDDFVEILPGQKTNLADHYLEYQLALTAALSSQTALPVLQEELHSPSVQFKRLVTKEVVRLDQDDNKLFEEIKNAVPALRKQLLHSCIKFRRVALLERLVPVLYEEHGVEAAADVLHGCSSTFVEEHLKQEEYLKCPRLRWAKLARYHSDVILTLFRAELEANSKQAITEWQLDSVWNKWFATYMKSTATKRLLYNGGCASKLLSILAEFPLLSYIGSLSSAPRLSEADPKYVHYLIPYFVQNHLRHFLKKCPEETLELIKKTFYIDQYHLLNCGVDQRTLWSTHCWKKLRSRGFDVYVMPLLKFVLSLSSKESLFHGSASQDNYCLQHMWVTQQFLAQLQASEIQKLFDVLAEFLQRMRPASLLNKLGIDSNSHISQWRSLARTLHTQIVDYAAQRIKTLKDKIKVLEGEKSVATNARPQRRGRRPKKNSNVTKDSAFERRVLRMTPEQKEKEKAGLEEGMSKYFALRKYVLEHFIRVLKEQWSWGLLDEGAKWRLEELESNSALQYVDDDPELLAYLFEHVYLHFAKGQDLNAAEWRRFNERFSSALLRNLYRLYEDKKSTEECRTRAKQVHSKVFDYFFDLFDSAPVERASYFTSIIHSCFAVQRFKIFELFDTEELEHLGKVKPDNMITLFQAIVDCLQTADSAKLRDRQEEEEPVDLTPLWTAVTALIEPGVLSDEQRDNLLAFQNVAQKEIRKALQAATFSNSTSERDAAFDHLIKASVRTKSIAQIDTTLKFIRKRIKNSKIVDRNSVLEVLQDSLTMLDEDLLLLAESLHAIYFDMLQDALDAPDIKEGHSLVEQVFRAISHRAIALSAGTAKTLRSALFDFGVELQWRLALFTQGQRKCMKEFRISFPSLKASSENKYFPRGSESEFVEAVVEAYTKRVTKNATFLDQLEVLVPIYAIVGRAWQQITPLQEHILKAIKQIKELKTDHEGLYVIENDSDILEVYNAVITANGGEMSDWHKHPQLSEFVETILRSRQARRVVIPWLIKHSGSKAERKKKREECVLKLLEISPSAIYLRFVWRFLVRYRQDLLDSFIESKKTFRGVFYLPPSNRGPLPKTPEERQTWWKGLYEEDEKKRLKQAKEDEKEFLEEQELAQFDEGGGASFDHEDMFCLPACWGLHRLLPRQAKALAQQRRHQFLNPDRALPDRVKAAQLWTCLPCVDYNEIVTVYEQYEGEGSEVPVSVLEAVLRGLMRTDEPCAPLHYLLSPKLLSSDRARVSAYSLSRSVPYIPASQMTQVLETVLSGKSLRNLKVTAHKELIRLLASRPCQTHFQMILAQWKRPTTHRDVRVLIIQKAISFLKKEVGEDIAWEILEDASNSKDVELLTTLLGAVMQGRSKTSLSGRITLKPRLQDHLDDLAHYPVPKKHAARYATDIVLKLTEAEDEDIRHLAIALMDRWVASDTQERMVQKLATTLLNVEEKYTDNKNPDIQTIYDDFFRQCVNGLVLTSGISNRYLFEGELQAMPEPVLDVLKGLWNATKSLAVRDRKRRECLLNRISALITAWPTAAQDKEIAEKLEQPLLEMNGLFEYTLIKRKAQQSYWGMSNEQYGEEILPLVHELIVVGANDPKASAEFMSSIRQTMINDTEKMLLLFKALFTNKLSPNNKHDEQASVTPAYTAFLEAVVLELYPDYPYFIQSSKETVKALCTFLETRVFAASSTYTNSAPCSQDTKAAKIVSIITNTNSQFNKRGWAVHPSLKKLVSFIVETYLSEGCGEAGPITHRGALARAVVYKLSRKLVVDAAPHTLCALAHALLSDYSHSPSDSSNTAAVNALTEFARLIDDREKYLQRQQLLGQLKTAVTGGLDESNQWKLSSPALKFIELLLKPQALTPQADPLPISNKNGKAPGSNGWTASACPSAFANVEFMAALGVLEQFPAFAAQCPEATLSFVHECLVRAVSHRSSTPTLTVTSLLQRLTNLITRGFTNETKMALLDEKDNPTAVKQNQATKKRVEEAVNRVEKFIRAIKSCSLAQNNNKKRKKGSNQQQSHLYKQLCQWLAFEVLTEMGEVTSVEVVLEPEATTEEEKEKEKEGESSTKVEGKKKKKKKTLSEWVWRETFEVLLDEFCESDIPELKLEAWKTQTRRQA